MGLGSLGIRLAWPIRNVMTTAGTTPGAERFITGAIIYAGRQARAAEASYNRPGAAARPFNGNTQALEDTLNPAVRAASARAPSAATSHGGQARSFSSRGSASFGGGAAAVEARGGGGGGGAWRRWRASVIEVSLCSW